MPERAPSVAAHATSRDEPATLTDGRWLALTPEVFREGLAQAAALGAAPETSGAALAARSLRIRSIAERLNSRTPFASRRLDQSPFRIAAHRRGIARHHIHLAQDCGRQSYGRALGMGRKGAHGALAGC